MKNEKGDQHSNYIRSEGLLYHIVCHTVCYLIENHPENQRVYMRAGVFALDTQEPYYTTLQCIQYCSEYGEC